MVVEHTFVTTMGQEDALRSAAEFLHGAGFYAPPEGAFALGPAGWQRLRMRRGMEKLTQAKRASDLPQEVRLEYDRGRVNLALSVMVPPQARKWGLSGIVWADDLGPSNKESPLLGAMLITLARSLELLLVYGQGERAMNEWQQMSYQADQGSAAHFARSRVWMVVAIIFVVFAVGALAAVIASMAD